MPRWMRVPAAITVLLLAGLPFARSPLERLDHPAAVGEGIRLVLSPAYLALDPFCRLLDALSLLSLTQHLALCATLFAAGLAWSLRRGRARAIGGVATTLGLIVLIYAAGIFLPRPLAPLAVDAPELLKIDFHSHTSASHDGEPGFDLERNRAWHTAAGFDAAYVSDHANWDSIRHADPQRSARAGGTVLLSAMEAGYGRARVIALGPQSFYEPALHGNQLDLAALAAGAPAGPRAATLIYTVPAPASVLRSHLPPQLPGLAAIEISDACPEGLAQTRQYRETLTAWADQANVALVTASNNHGLGRTAAAWTLMALPGWRDLGAAELAGAIEARLRHDGRRATTVVALRAPAGNLAGWRAAATVPAMAWNLWRTLAPAERLSWAGYACGLALLGRWWRRPQRALPPLPTGRKAVAEG